MASFNVEDHFRQYLATIDPHQAYAIEKLTGGLVNYTVRATRVPADDDDDHRLSRFPGHDSIIIKHAPPFIAAIGEAAKFSPFRQTIEATALALFGPGGELSSVAQTSSISVPQLLHHDDAAHMLIMSDLGYLQNLSSKLRALQNTSKSPEEMSTTYCRIGTRIGSFFADLHCPSTASTIGSERLATFHNPDAKAAVYENNVEPLHGYLTSYGGIPDSAQLASRVTAGFTALNDEAPVFSFGDAWTGAVILSEEGPGECSGSTGAIGIVDWEFASKGRGLNGDMAQLLADLQSYLLESEGTAEPMYMAAKALIDSIVGSYHRQSRRNGSPWILQETTEAGSKEDLPDSLAEVLRSAFILHGREIIIAAFTGSWTCKCCGSGDEKTNTCAVRKAKVEKGVGYLRAAGDDILQFKAGQWKDEENGVLSGLVFGD